MLMLMARQSQNPEKAGGDTMIGPAKPVDTNQFFVIGVNNFTVLYLTGPCKPTLTPAKFMVRTFQSSPPQDWVTHKPG
jgi:homoserine O-acetyltransferase